MTKELIILLACYNDEDDSYEAISLTHGILRRRFLDELYFYLKDYVIKYIPSNYKFGNYVPDIIFIPKLVVHARTFLLCLSQDSAVGYDLIKKNFGIGLRFPRVMKVREDKKVNEICTSKKIISLYNNQNFTQSLDYEQIGDGPVEKEGNDNMYNYDLPEWDK